MGVWSLSGLSGGLLVASYCVVLPGGVIIDGGMSGRKLRLELKNLCGHVIREQCFYPQNYYQELACERD